MDIRNWQTSCHLKRAQNKGYVMSSNSAHLTPEDLERIYAIVEKVSMDVSTRAVQSTLISLGIDPSNPIEAQKDMAALREIRLTFSDPQFQADMMHLRTWRSNLEQIKSRGTAIVFTLSSLGLAGLALYAVENKLFF